MPQGRVWGQCIASLEQQHTGVSGARTHCWSHMPKLPVMSLPVPVDWVYRKPSTPKRSASAPLHGEFIDAPTNDDAFYHTQPLQLPTLDDHADHLCYIGEAGAVIQQAAGVALLHASTQSTLSTLSTLLARWQQHRSLNPPPYLLKVASVDKHHHWYTSVGLVGSQGIWVRCEDVHEQAVFALGWRAGVRRQLAVLRAASSVWWLLWGVGSHTEGQEQEQDRVSTHNTQ